MISNSQGRGCEHSTQVALGNHKNCATCNAFISTSDGQAAIKDSSLGGMHTTYPAMILQRLCAETAVLSLDPARPISGAYASIRRMLVDWLGQVGRRLRLSERVLHLAVLYMDYILGQKDYAHSKYQLIGLSCLAIAAKFEELDRKIPYPEDYARVAKLAFRAPILKECEILLLKVLDWKLKVATAYDVVHCLLAQGVLFVDDLIHTQVPREADAILLTAIAKFLVLDSLRSNLQCHRVVLAFVSCDPATLGIALVLCARKALGLKEVWNPRMAELTMRDFETVEACYKAAEMYSSGLRT